MNPSYPFLSPPLPIPSRYSSAGALAGGGLQRDGSGKNYQFRHTCGRIYQPTTRTVPRGCESPRGNSIWQARYLHSELGLSLFDIADLLRVRVEQVAGWLQ